MTTATRRHREPRPEDTNVQTEIHHALTPPRFIEDGIRFASTRREPAAPFTWPLQAFGNVEPRVLASHDGNRLGVDLGYAPALCGHELLVPVFAANDGEVACALDGTAGCAISLDHGGTWTTHYTGLAKLALIRCLPRLRRRERVCAGQVIAYATQPRIGFELWKWTDEDGFVAVDPRAYLASWANAPASSTVPKKEAA